MRPTKDYDAALVWKDAATGFSVMTSKKKDASFNAAAEGKLKISGMSVYAQWFEEGIKLGDVSGRDCIAVFMKARLPRNDP